MAKLITTTGRNMHIDNKFKFDFNISEPKKVGNIAIFGLSPVTETKGDYLSLSEALKNNLATVSEVLKEPFIFHLLVKNYSSQNLLLIEGELFVNSYNVKLLQDRVLNTTLVIAPYKSAYVPVSCVEKSRWNYSSLRYHRLSVNEDFYFPQARMRKNQDVYYSSRDYGYKFADQMRVWDAIDEKIEKIGAHSRTFSINTIYERKRIELEEKVKKFKANTSDCGIIYGIGSNLIGIDIFNKNSIFQQFLPKLIRAICIDSYDYPKISSSLQKKDAVSFLKLVQQSQFEEHKSIGREGVELRSNHTLFIAQGLFNEKYKSVIHFSAFTKDKGVQPERMAA